MVLAIYRMHGMGISARCCSFWFWGNAFGFVNSLVLLSCLVGKACRFCAVLIGDCVAVWRLVVHTMMPVILNDLIREKGEDFLSLPLSLSIYIFIMLL